MKLKTLKLKNFRCYKDEISIDLCDLTAFVGKNDIGKSCIMEALDIFFNDGKGSIKIDKQDINKQAAADGDTDIYISACFEELPDRIVIDVTNETTLQSEFLLNSNQQLEIIKKFPNAGAVKVFVKAYHPTNAQCADLLQKKDTDLRRIIEHENIRCEDRTRNAVMRTAIWNHYTADLRCSETEIDISKGDTKSIWGKLQEFLPLYSLFKSDRENSDSDSEVQDPLMESVKQILRDPTLQQKLNEIANEIRTNLNDVSTRTLQKLREMDPLIAASLNPVIPTTESLKWADVFKNVRISGDNDIPINKRGSGVKRLVLLNFFRAEAERRRGQRNCASIIYAIEEPETSQHTEYQKKLIKALIDLASEPNTQIIITTHSAALVKELQFENLRLISVDGGIRMVKSVEAGQLPYPSLNEVNFQAFSEISEEYHNELYGFIEAEGQLSAFKTGKPTIRYQRQTNGNPIDEQKILTEYIRHQIHHPENTLNQRYPSEQLSQSICLMRDFINVYRQPETNNP